MNRRDQNTLEDRHNRIVAQLLTRFRNMIEAVSERVAESATISEGSQLRMRMDRECAALITEVENLLALNRELKQLWITGPLRDSNDAANQAREEHLDEGARVVMSMSNHIIALQNEVTLRNVNAVEGISPWPAETNQDPDPA
ncbi:hypothetical protein F5Y18DRAFT_227071 [Xylariaceae sp. FL1019]|nr:hypothetical protein F5Y18DRAFT_227071 [Xylariaceae sp. FL1019]